MKSKIASVILLLCVIFIPMFDTWSGIIPSSEATRSWDLLDHFSEIFDWYDYAFIASGLFPSIFLTVSAFLNGKILCIIFALLGIISLLWILTEFILQNGADEAFDFKDCSVSIGFWIALIMFIINLIINIKDIKGDS